MKLPGKGKNKPKKKKKEIHLHHFGLPKLIKFKSAEDSRIGKEKESRAMGKKSPTPAPMISVSWPCGLRKN